MSTSKKYNIFYMYCIIKSDVLSLDKVEHSPINIRGFFDENRRKKGAGPGAGMLSR